MTYVAKSAFIFSIIIASPFSATIFWPSMQELLEKYSDHVILPFHANNKFSNV
jgi:hypothetical protein